MDSSDKTKIDLEREHIVVKVKNWLRQAQTYFEEVVNPNISPGDVVLKVTGKKYLRNTNRNTTHIDFE